MSSNEHHSPDLVPRPTTFTAKFRRRRKVKVNFSHYHLLTTFTLITFLCLLPSPVHSLPFISSTQTNGASPETSNGDCEMGSCFGGSGNAQPNLISMPCPALKALHQCLKTLKCNGNLQYHTFQWMVRNSKRRCRSGAGDNQKVHHHHNSRSNRRQQSRTPPKEQQPPPQQPSSTPSLLRSGEASFASFQQQLINSGKQSTHPLSVLSPPGPSLPSPPPFSHTSAPQNSLPWKTVSEQYCLSAAYNFTIGEPVVDSVHFAAIAYKQSSVAVANPEEQFQLASQLAYSKTAVSSFSEDETMQNAFSRRGRRLQRRDTTENARIDAEMKRRLGDAFKDYFRGQMQQHKHNPSKPEEGSLQEQIGLQQHQQAARAYRDTSTSSSSKPDAQTNRLTDLHYKPVAPMTPSLTCMIFGDPHLRTFDSRYQTCSIVGARSLIEHPLFDVQITNTRLQEQFNATGVTKVIVQMRHFSPCGIATDLLYETDSLTQDLPSTTFTDGSREHPSGLIRISTSSEALGLVVTLHLDHLGVRIYLSQFTHTKFINVVIKFRTATSASVKQKLVLEAISGISLCKSGCGRGELVDVQGTLKAAGIETRGGKGDIVKNQVPQKVDEDENHQDRLQNETDSEDEEEDQETDEVFIGKVTGTVEEEEYYDEDDDSDDDGDYSESADQQLMNPQKDPRSKRVKKSPKNDSKEAKQNRKNRRREQRKQNRSQKKLEIETKQRDLESHFAPSSAILGLQSPPLISSVPESPPPHPLAVFSSDQEQQPPPPPQAYQSKPPSLTEECNEMMPFYRLACLYDTVLKGIVSNYPHKFALSFDEPRLPAEFYLSPTSNDNSGSGVRSSSPSSSGGGSPSSAGSPRQAWVTFFLGAIISLLLTQL